MEPSSLGHETQIAGARGQSASADRPDVRLGVGPGAGRTVGEESKAAAAAVAGEQLVDFAADEGGELPAAVRELINRCLEGTEPYGRELKTWEQDKFNSRHVNMVMLRAAGFKGGEIAQAMGATQAMVSWTLNHPYGRKIIHALMTARGTRVLDIRTKLDQYADQILDQIFELTCNSSDLETVSKVGFGLLDRAGYGATQKVQHDVKPAEGAASESTLSRVASALEASAMVNAVIMPAYIPKPPPEDSLGRGEVGSSAESAPRGSGALPASGPGPTGPGFDQGIRLAKVSGS
jgi:predicted transcriptional regulator